MCWLLSLVCGWDWQKLLPKTNLTQMSYGKWWFQKSHCWTSSTYKPQSRLGLCSMLNPQCKLLSVSEGFQCLCCLKEFITCFLFFFCSEAMLSRTFFYHSFLSTVIILNSLFQLDLSVTFYYVALNHGPLSDALFGNSNTEKPLLTCFFTSDQDRTTEWM